MEFAGLARRRGWRAAFVAAAALGALVPIPARVIDRQYSAGIYPVLQRALTRLSNLVPMALLDVLIVTTIVAVGVAAWRDWRRAGAATMAVRFVVREADGDCDFSRLAHWSARVRSTCNLIKEGPGERSMGHDVSGHRCGWRAHGASACTGAVPGTRHFFAFL